MTETKSKTTTTTRCIRLAPELWAMADEAARARYTSTPAWLRETIRVAAAAVLAGRDGKEVEK